MERTLKYRSQIAPTLVMALNDFAKQLDEDAANLGTQNAERVRSMEKDFKDRAEELRKLAEEVQNADGL